VRAARLLLLLAIAAGIAVSAASGAATRKSSATAASHARQPAAGTSRTFVVSAGKAERRFTMRERSGLILLSRITAPHGVQVHVYADVPKVAGVAFSTVRRSAGPALSCDRDGKNDVCTQKQEWCPMPGATWQLRLIKTAGPAGPIRIDFVVGPPASGA
jgi:hypothetical protein